MVPNHLSDLTLKSVVFSSPGQHENIRDISTHLSFAEPWGEPLALTEMREDLFFSKVENHDPPCRSIQRRDFCLSYFTLS